MVFLAPSLARVLDAADRYVAGVAPAQAVLDSMPDALRFSIQGGQLFRSLQSAILRTAEIDELVHQIQLEHDAQLASLKGLEQAARDGRVHSISRYTQEVRFGSERLLELLSTLGTKEQHEQTFSPYPVLAQFIKTGINLLNGYLESAQLQARMGAVVGMVEGLRGDVERFALLYQHPALVDQARHWVGELEAGLGAVLAYLQQANKQALQDGLKLLGSASAGLGEVMKHFDRVVSSEIRFSRLPYLEELGRALEGQRQGKLPEALLRRAWDRVQEALGQSQLQLDNLRRSPFHSELEESLAQASLTWERCRLALASADLKTLTIGSLEPHFASLNQQVGSLLARLSEESARFAGAPHLAALREMVGRALLGTVPPAELKSGLEDHKRQHAELTQQLQPMAQDPLCAELLQLLGAHGMAFTRMELFFDDGDQEHLRQGWKLISITLERVLKLSEQLRRQMAPDQDRFGPKEVICFRCGTRNRPDQRSCKQCQAVLPKVSQEVTDYTEVSLGGWGPQASTGPANLLLIEALAEQAETGQITREIVGQEIDKLLKHADRTRQAFEKQVIQLMGQDPTFDAYAGFFAMKMGFFVQGLMQMRNFAEGGSLSHLHSGAATCREAGEELQMFQETIQQALSQARR